jgi:hypothetical protein
MYDFYASHPHGSAALWFEWVLVVGATYQFDKMSGVQISMGLQLYQFDNVSLGQLSVRLFEF